MLQVVNCTFNQTVTASADVKFDNCTFAAQGTNKKDTSSLGLKIVGDANAEVSNSKFENQGYSAIGIQTSGSVNISNNIFDCSKVYNPVEGTVTAGAAVGEVNISNNIFDGVCGNNYLNFYKMEDGAVVTIEGNKFTTVSPDSEVLRLSNVDNTSATFNVNNNSYTFVDATEGDYTAFILCQDFTNKQGKKQDFSKYTVNINNLECNAQKVVEKPVQGKMFVVYEDGKGIITDNDPVVIVK